MRRGVAITLSPSRRRIGVVRALRRAGLAPEAVAVALEVVDLAVVEQAIGEGAARALSWSTRPHSVRLLFEVMIVPFFSYRVAMTS